MLERYHARSTAVYLLTWFLLALLYNGAAQLTLMLTAVLFFNYRADKLRAFKNMVPYMIPLALLIVAINILFNQNGALPLAAIRIGGHTVVVYREAVAFGVAMALKLMLILTIFILFNQLLPVERIMDVFGRCSGPAVLLTALSVRLTPDLALRARSISQTQRSRSMAGQGRGLAQGIRNLGPLVFNLLRAALQTALEMAEAMQARGYGAGRRSVYRRERWRTRDWVLVLLALLALGLAAAGCHAQHGTPLQEAALPARPGEALLLLLLFLPALIGPGLWGRKV